MENQNKKEVLILNNNTNHLHTNNVEIKMISKIKEKTENSEKKSLEKKDVSNKI